MLLVLLAGCATLPTDETTAETTAEQALDRPLRILSYNIKHGEGMDGVVDLERSAAKIRALDPDLVALQEIDRGCGRTGGVDQAQWLGKATGLHAAFGSFMDYDGGEYGMAILSRWPIVASVNHRLPPGVEPRSALEVVVEAGHAQRLRFVGIHLYCTEEERLAQAGVLIDSLAGSELPVVLCGDFNSEPDSPVLDALHAHFSPIDKGEDHFTFRSDRPYEEIDYTMIRAQDGFEVLESDVLDEPLVSDHRPLWTVLRWRRTESAGE